jgi:hypothetical protein
MIRGHLGGEGSKTESKADGVVIIPQRRTNHYGSERHHPIARGFGENCRFTSHQP